MKEGDKIKFIEKNVTKEQINWGSHDDPNGILKLGSEYTIHHVDVRSWHTKVFLSEFPDKQFNSVWFE